jgi:integrase
MAVEKHRDGFRVRRKVDGTRRYFGVFKTEEEARQMDVAVADESDDTGASTLRDWGERWLDRREHVEHVRGIRTERSRWRTHVETAAFIDLPLPLIDAEHGEKWLDALLTKKTSPLSGRYRNAKPKPLSRKTVRETVILVRQCLDDAIPKYIAANPFAPLAKRFKKATKKRGAEATEEPWTYLEPDEQTQLRCCQKIPEPHRLMIAFGMLSGMREGEQFNLELPDLVVEGDDPHLVVRFGSRGEPPKNGKIRRLPLSDDLLAVCRRWVEILPSYCPDNPHQLVFPLPSGARVQEGKHALYKSVKVKVKDKTKVRKVDLFRTEYLPAAGIVAKQRHDRRSVRWHDLRHTAGSSLVAGWWGRRWTLEEVKEYLGHSSILVTQRYAHLGQTALKKAVRETVRGAPPVPHKSQKLRQESRVSSGNDSVGRQGLEPWTYGLKDLD